MVTMGRQLLERAGTRKIVSDAAHTLRRPDGDPRREARHRPDPKLTAAIDAKPLASLATFSEPIPLRVERERAGVGSWYEFFPRSEGAKRAKDGTWTSGTFRSAAKRLPAVAEMGFDVLYLPPIHPDRRGVPQGSQ